MSLTNKTKHYFIFFTFTKQFNATIQIRLTYKEHIMNTLLKTLGLSLALTVVVSANAELYTKCATCHGSSGEKQAFGKGKVIKDMAKADIVTALKGYQDGTYGGVSKALMKAQTSGLSDDQITSIAELIGK